MVARAVVERRFARLRNGWTLSHLRVRGSGRVWLQADLRILAELGCGIRGERAVSLMVAYRLIEQSDSRDGPLEPARLVLGGTSPLLKFLRVHAGPPIHAVWRPGGAMPTTSGGLPDRYTVLLRAGRSRRTADARTPARTERQRPPAPPGPSRRQRGRRNPRGQIHRGVAPVAIPRRRDPASPGALPGQSTSGSPPSSGHGLPATSLAPASMGERPPGSRTKRRSHRDAHATAGVAAQLESVQIEQVDFVSIPTRDVATRDDVVPRHP
jgi:hypothetical protein